MALFLTTLETLRIVLGATPSDAELTFYGEAAQDAVRKYCDRDFNSQSYTHYFNGTNTQRLVLRQTPVTAVSSVHVDVQGYFGTGTDPFNSLTALTSGRDYVLDVDGTTTSKSGILFRIGAVWPMLNRVVPVAHLAADIGPAWGNIKVVYTAGYATVPLDLQMATTTVAVQLRNIVRLGGDKVQKETIGDYSYTLYERMNSGPELGSVRTTLARYKEYGW